MTALRASSSPTPPGSGDADARENYRIWLAFRQRLASAPSLEAAYARLFQGEGVDVPPLFVHELTRILVRHVLGERADPIEARVAEALFRPQRVAILDDGSVMAADEETVERQATTGGFGHLGELLAKHRVPMRTIDVDVLSRDNAERYWERDERHDFAIGLNRGQPALEALCRLIERWVRHFLGVDVRVSPQSRIDDDRWVWHVGLDAEASAILNDLYNRVEVDETRLARLVALFRLDFADPADARPTVAGFLDLPTTLAGAEDLAIAPNGTFAVTSGGSSNTHLAFVALPDLRPARGQAAQRPERGDQVFRQVQLRHFRIGEPGQLHSQLLQRGSLALARGLARRL